MYQRWEGERHLLTRYPILKKRTPLGSPTLVNLDHLPAPELFMTQKKSVNYIRGGGSQPMWSTKCHSRRFVVNGWRGYFLLLLSMMRGRVQHVTVADDVGWRNFPPRLLGETRESLVLSQGTDLMKTKGSWKALTTLINAESVIHRIKVIFVAVAEGNDEKEAYGISMKFRLLRSKRGCPPRQSWRE